MLNYQPTINLFSIDNSLPADKTRLENHFGSRPSQTDVRRENAKAGGLRGRVRAERGAALNAAPPQDEGSGRRQSTAKVSSGNVCAAEPTANRSRPDAKGLPGERAA
jgi:hypothetical protein